MTEAMVRTTQNILVNSGTLVSGNINLVGARGAFAVSVPTIASAANVFIQVGQQSGSYVGRLQDPTSQTALLKAAGNGSLALVIDAWPWPHDRIELSVAQPTNTSLQALTFGARSGVGADKV